jgi:anhydro-N-acetylmuramic acid kinase
MKDFYSIGLMSGSSLDGLDLCYSKISSKDENCHFEIIASETIPYDNDVYEKLKKVREISSLDLHFFDIELGKLFGAYCNSFIGKNNIKQIDAVSNHGHTVFHYPEKGLTLQIGNNNWIAKMTNIPIFGNLRMRNITHGGQGAPIVPIADKYLFSEFDNCINLGGISNITIKKGTNLKSFDIGICNQLLNYLCNLIDKKYDQNGDIAATGTINLELLNALEKIPFYQIQPPKSIDNGMLKETVLPIFDSYKDSVPNLLATAAEHIAIEISKYLEKDSKTIITGGGAYNSFLISRIQSISNAKITIPNPKIIEFKEALAMSFMALRSIENRPNTLSNTTGSEKDCISGDWIYN